MTPKCENCQAFEQLPAITYGKCCLHPPVWTTEGDYQWSQPIVDENDRCMQHIPKLQGAKE